MRTDGPWYYKMERRWYMVIDGAPWEDTDGDVQYFTTAEQAQDAAEKEVYGPRREAKRK